MPSPKDDRQLPVIILDLDLDDLPLSPYAVRIYIRIVRRAGHSLCWESLPSMAAGCHMSLSVARRALRELVSANMVSITERKGDTSLVRVTPKTTWKLENIHPKSGPTPIRSDTTTPIRSGTTSGGTPIRSDTTTPIRSDIRSITHEEKKEEPPNPQRGDPPPLASQRAAEIPASAETGFTLTPPPVSEKPPDKVGACLTAVDKVRPEWSSLPGNKKHRRALATVLASLVGEAEALVAMRDFVEAYPGVKMAFAATDFTAWLRRVRAQARQELQNKHLQFSG